MNFISFDVMSRGLYHIHTRMFVQLNAVVAVELPRDARLEDNWSIVNPAPALWLVCLMNLLQVPLCSAFSLMIYILLYLLQA